jgi:hypothetical protein
MREGINAYNTLIETSEATSMGKKEDDIVMGLKEMGLQIMNRVHLVLSVL